MQMITESLVTVEFDRDHGVVIPYARSGGIDDDSDEGFIALLHHPDQQEGMAVIFGTNFDSKDIS